MGALALAVLAAGAPARAQESGPSSAGVAYDATIEGEASDSLRRRLRAVARVFESPEPSFASLAALRRQARQDARSMRRLLVARGYYAGDVSSQTIRVASSQGGPQAQSPNATVVFHLRTGPRFTITGYRIVYRDDVDAERPATLAQAGVEPDFSPRGADVAAVEAALVTRLRNSGFPTARRIDRRAQARFETGEAEIVFELESGPAARFGPVDWRGLERTRQGFLNRQIPWEPGAPFDRATLSAYRDTLAETGLFRFIQLEPGPPDEDGIAAVIATVREGPPRSIGAGVSYATNRGAGGQVFWEHRNLFRRGERLRIEGEAAQVEQALAVQLRKPYPRRRLAAFIGVESARDDNEAFRATRVTTNAGFDKRFRTHWTGRAGVEVETSRSEDAFGETNALLVALPVRASWDTVADALDPKDGVRVAADLVPVSGDAQGDLVFLRQELTLAAHRPLNDERTVVAATWARVGATTGAETEEIPATRRIYAGGGGSVRAYGFQQLGPLDEDNQPLGGRSLAEGGVELRGRITPRWGAAVFLEAGTVTDSAFPDFSEDVLAGAGLGLRFYTPVGPFRLDLAAPFDRRGGVDDPVQVYVSFGQAF